MVTPSAPPLSGADRLLGRVLRRSPTSLVIVLIAQLVAAAAGLIAPTVLATAVDAVLAGHAPLVAVARLGIVLTLEIGAGVLAIVGGARVTARGTSWLRRLLLDRLLVLNGSTRYGPGDLTGRLVGDADQITAIGPLMVDTLSRLLLSVGALGALALIDWWLAVAFAAALPVVWLVTRKLVTSSSTEFVHYSRVLARIADALGTALTGIRTIRASGTLDHETQRILTHLPDLTASGHRLWAAQRRAACHLGIIVPLVLAGMLTLAGFFTADGRITPGAFVAVGTYSTLAFGLLDQVEQLLAFAHLRGGAARVAEILDHETVAAGSAELRAGSGELVLRDVTVGADTDTHATHASLSQVSLRIPAGTCCAVVGTATSGASVLAMVAGGLRTPDSGEVLLDGASPADLAPAARRRAVAYAPERPVLFGRSIADSIAFGAPHATRANIEQAARDACADTFIRRLPSGFDTPMTEAPLSGGEAQRLGLARAIIRDARLTILDDATSSLDVTTEMLVSTAITDRSTNRTRLVVTHRAATAARTDLVVWLEHGRLRAVAPHAHLWQVPQYRAVFGETATDPADEQDQSGTANATMTATAATRP